MTTCLSGMPELAVGAGILLVEQRMDAGLAGRIVTCRAHGLRYDVTTGRVTSTTGLGVETYPVKIESGRIMVAVSTE